MTSAAEKLKNNKSIAILDAAEKGGYGVVSVVCVNLTPVVLFAGAEKRLMIINYVVQPRGDHCDGQGRRVSPLTGHDPALPLGPHAVQIASRELRR